MDGMVGVFWDALVDHLKGEQPINYQLDQQQKEEKYIKK